MRISDWSSDVCSSDLIGIKAFTPIPISGFRGDNITGLSANTPWYKGPALMEHLETVEVDQVSDREKPFRMAVQWVNRPNLDFRGFSGQIATGTVRVGDPLRVQIGRASWRERGCPYV